MGRRKSAGAGSARSAGARTPPDEDATMRVTTGRSQMAVIRLRA